MSNSVFVRTALLLITAALILPVRVEASEARCSAGIQKEYGKYFSCALKAISKATHAGGRANLLRCQAKLDKKLIRLVKKYGTDCSAADANTLADVADQCIDNTAEVSIGHAPPKPTLGDNVICSPNALVSDLSIRPVFSAKNPPTVASMSITPFGNGVGRFEVSYADPEGGICLPAKIPLKLGKREAVTLVSKNRTRTFTANVRIDSEEWVDYEHELEAAAAAADAEVQPVFDRRAKSEIDALPTQPIDLSVVDTRIALSLKPVIDPAIVDPERTLMVTDVSVIEDPARTFDPCDPVGTQMGPWTFGHLLQEMANQPLTGIAPSNLVLDWLDQWTTVQTVNGQNIPARVAMQDVIDRWLLASQVAGAPPGQLDLGIAPFRLMAIVNRIDLRENAVYNGGNCGEGRFVFGVLDTDTCEPIRFTVIFEYGVNMTTCRSCKKYARAWFKLQTHPLGSAAYLSRLEALTRLFSDANTNPGKPNSNSINQIRTNEIALASPWELREFNLMANGFLGHVTNKQNPRQDLNFSLELANWVNANAADICAGNYTVPDTLPTLGIPFLAVHVPYDLGDFFDGPAGAASIRNRCARFQLSLNSCSGCHSGETTTTFTHIGDSGRRPLGTPALLSGFLTGAEPPNPVADPADSTPQRSFDDLTRRQIDLWHAAHVPCLPTLAFDPLNAVH